MASLFYIYGKDDLDLKWEIKSGDVKFIIEKYIKKPSFQRGWGRRTYTSGGSSDSLDIRIIISPVLLGEPVKHLRAEALTSRAELALEVR